MRNVTSGMRWLILCAAYAILRCASSLGRPIAVFPDTTGYITSGATSQRQGVVHFLFTLVSTNTSRVGIQIVMGILAWCCAAWVAAGLTRYPTIAASAVLIIGLMPQVIRYDLTVLSESIGISLAVLAISTTVGFMARHSMWMGVACALSITALCSVRSSYLIAGVIALVTVALMAAQHRSVALYFTSAVLVLGGVWNYHQTTSDKGISNLNMYSVLIARVVTSDTRYAWFVDHGMPDVTGARDAVSYDDIGTLDETLASQLQLPTNQAPPSLMRVGGNSLATWVGTHGWSTWMTYVRTHPHDAWNMISPLLTPTLSPANDSFLPISSRNIVPRIFFLPWQWWCILIAAGVLGLSLSQRRLAGAIALTAIAIGATCVATLLTSGIEHPRHMAAVAVGVRLLALLAVVPLFPCRISPEISTPESSPKSRRRRMLPQAAEVK